MSPRIVAVAARARNGVIGAGNALPWRLSSDLKRFKALTLGKPMIMGRRTWDSIGRPLPGRETIAVSRDPGFSPAGAHVAKGLPEALRLAETLAAKMGANEIIVAGGGEIFAALLPLTDVVHMTEIALDVDGDALFPPLDPREWRESARETPPRGEKDEADFAYVTFERIRA